MPQSRPFTPTRRTVLAGLAGAVLTPAPAFAGDEDLPPAIARDYGGDRETFRTRLLRSGPAPDSGDTLDAVPDGTRLMAYRSGDLALTGWRSPHRPGERRPAVLLLHGGNALARGHWALAEPFIRAGYAVFTPALRAENGQGGAFSGFYDETDDVLAAAQALASEPDVDAARLYLAGHSVGGTLTLLAALASARFRAAASFSGNPDAAAFFRHFPQDIRFDTQDPREFEMRSPLCYAASLRCPALVLHGTRERLAVAPTRAFCTRARGAGRMAVYGAVPGDHFSSLPESIRRALAFFRQNGSGALG